MESERDIPCMDQRSGTFGPVYMRPGRSQTEMKIEIINMFP
jgi:hypothetical protein